MKKIILLFTIFSISTATLTDIDGNTYETVQIGDQVWMAENLKVTHYNNGDEIPNIIESSEWVNTTTGASGVYNNNPTAFLETYGRLYNWRAVADDRGVCPAGWHVPSDDEWKSLEMELGMSQSHADIETGVNGNYRGVNESVGAKLAGELSLWASGDLINNSEFGQTGFNAPPGGRRNNWSGTYAHKSIEF